MLSVLFSQGKTIYSFDASAILDAYARWYPMECFPSLWSKLYELAQEDRLKVISFAFDELTNEDNALKKWCQDLKGLIHVGIEGESIQRIVRDLLAKHKKLLGEAKNRSGADPWIIALAKEQSMTVVTGEKLSGNLDKPKIPDVCADYGIRCIDIMQLIKDEGWIF